MKQLKKKISKSSCPAEEYNIYVCFAVSPKLLMILPAAYILNAIRKKLLAGETPIPTVFIVLRTIATFLKVAPESRIPKMVSAAT